MKGLYVVVGLCFGFAALALVPVVVLLCILAISVMEAMF